MSQAAAPEPVDRRETIRETFGGAESGPAGATAATTADYAHGERVVYDAAAQRRQILRRVTQLFWLLVIVVEIVMGLRFVLKLVAANPTHPFARAVYTQSELFVAGFRGLTPEYTLGGSLLETHTIIAMVLYVLVIWVVVRLVWLLFDRPVARSVTIYDRGASSPTPPDERRAA